MTEDKSAIDIILFFVSSFNRAPLSVAFKTLTKLGYHISPISLNRKQTPKRCSAMVTNNLFSSVTDSCLRESFIHFKPGACQKNIGDNINISRNDIASYKMAFKTKHF